MHGNLPYHICWMDFTWHPETRLTPFLATNVFDVRLMSLRCADAIIIHMALIKNLRIIFI